MAPKKRQTRKKATISKRKSTSFSQLKKELLLEQSRTQKLLLQNFVALQEVLTNVSDRFNILSKNIAQLLKIFEDSAKSLAEKEFQKDKQNEFNKDMIEKLDKLLEQNKLIAKGITLIYNIPEEKKEAPKILEEKKPEEKKEQEPEIQNDTYLQGYFSSINPQVQPTPITPKKVEITPPSPNSQNPFV